MRFTTSRLVLKSITHKDALALYSVLNDPLVAQYNDYGDSLSHEQIKDLIQWDLEQGYLGLGCRMAITNAQGLLLGTVGLYDFDADKQSVNIGFELASVHWRHGYMSEAVQCILVNIGQLLNISSDISVFAHLDENNERSAKLLLKLGFSKQSDNLYRKLLTA
ncbi:GNAT family N-acetyltransferase [Pseudoalteromonas sp. MMG022]|uniref:GNAT family N-acetyltransferase n=1 Tax=Pseudoalteromonas sp. MMG022 TaxID=2909978 RepID=UPI001F3A24DB|nr:GNAT family N-acetyltransferase [Pseudoalteromonas sp. MMG022]MCF6433907.1 GNAT family N-acetyltransferase [Pseudoalteromonas sp. MMG022]